MYVLTVDLVLSVVHNKTFHYTDTHIYVFPLPLVKNSSCDHEPWNFELLIYYNGENET